MYQENEFFEKNLNNLINCRFQVIATLSGTKESDCHDNDE